MVYLAEVIRKYLGWCPAAGEIRTAPPVIIPPPVITDPAGAGGGTGRPGRIDRGAGLAMGSVRILLQNLKILWFSFLIGIVMIFSLVSGVYLQYLSGTDPFPGLNLGTDSSVVLIAKGSPEWGVLAFGTALVTMLVTNYLLAALFICVSRILSGKATTLGEGLSGAGQYAPSLAGWALFGALLGTLNTYIAAQNTHNLPLILASTIVILVFFALTMYVIPAIVLDNRNLVAAITDSLSVFRKTWGEIVICYGIFFLIAFAVSFTSVVPMIAIAFSSGSTAQAGMVVLVYMLLMLCLAFIGWTVMGIATLGLFTYGKTGAISPVFEGKTGVEAPV
jgi:hypothetical protein